MLKLAEQFALTIVEDDIFADFERTSAPRLWLSTGLTRAHVYRQLLQTISASARCGFVAARPEWIEGLIDMKIATSFGGGRLNAELVLAVLGDGGYRKHMEALRVRLAGDMPSAAAKLKAIVPSCG